MMLNGVIDAAVQGGTDKYRAAFFSDKFLHEHPESAEDVLQLKKLIGFQVKRDQ
jgi:hypothetical protein